MTTTRATARTPLSSRLAAVASVLVLGATLAACGGSDDDTSDAADEAASVAPPDLADATSGDTDLDGEADAGSALTAEEFCGFLTETAPDVVDLEPAEYAAATFGSAIFTFYSDQGLVTDIDGADMDALAAEGCPDEAAELLSALEKDSFADLLAS